MNLSFFGYQWENKSNFIIIEFEMPIQTRFSTSLKYEVLLCFWVSSYSADSCRSLFRSLKINPFWKAMIPKFQTKGIQNINLSMWNLEIYCLMVGTRIRWSDRCPIDNLTTCCLNKYGHDNENVWTLMKPQFSSRFLDSSGAAKSRSYQSKLRQYKMLPVSPKYVSSSLLRDWIVSPFYDPVSAG